MKTTFLQSVFKIVLLLIGLTTGAGCDDSDKWETEGMDVTCQLVKIVENGTEVEIPITPLLTLKKDQTFEGGAGCNSIQGIYRHNANNGRFIIEDLTTTELGCISPYSEAESTYLGYFRKISSFKQEGGNIKFYFGKDSYLEYKLTSKRT